ncbi:MAG TPA: hypothetical protein PLK34_01765 [Candidatus Pacearchaeota archaeon]|nr:hypothetical protein [Candidatus Pacearchaeota archaeon]
MAIISKDNFFGVLFFIIGVILAVLIGIFTSLIPVPALIKISTQIYAVLVILGVVVGFSIKMIGKDSQTFLLAGAVLVVVSKFGMDSVRGSLIGIGVGDFVASIFGALLALFVPATIIVAIKMVMSIQRV